MADTAAVLNEGSGWSVGTGAGVAGDSMAGVHGVTSAIAGMESRIAELSGVEAELGLSVQFAIAGEQRAFQNAPGTSPLATVGANMNQGGASEVMTDREIYDYNFASFAKPSSSDTNKARQEDFLYNSDLVYESAGLGTAVHGIYYENVLTMKSKADKVAYMKRMEHYK